MTVERRRPIFITVLAVLILIGAVSLLLCMFVPIPAVLFGWMIDGWRKVALYLVFAVLAATMGVGLWKLKPWGWWLALAMQV
jgi:hypothetical protein